MATCYCRDQRDQLCSIPTLVRSYRSDPALAVSVGAPLRACQVLGHHRLGERSWRVPAHRSRRCCPTVGYQKVKIQHELRQTKSGTQVRFCSTHLLLWMVGFKHRHIREIDCSLAVGGRQAAAYSHGPESEGKSIHWPLIQHESVFYGSWLHNYYCQQKEADQAYEKSIYGSKLHWCALLQKLL